MDRLRPFPGSHFIDLAGSDIARRRMNFSGRAPTQDSGLPVPCAKRPRPDHVCDAADRPKRALASGRRMGCLGRFISHGRDLKELRTA